MCQYEKNVLVFMKMFFLFFYLDTDRVMIKYIYLHVYRGFFFTCHFIFLWNFNRKQNHALAHSVIKFSLCWNCDIVVFYFLLQVIFQSCHMRDCDIVTADETFPEWCRYMYNLHVCVGISFCISWIYMYAIVENKNNFKRFILKIVYVTLIFEWTRLFNEFWFWIIHLNF